MNFSYTIYANVNFAHARYKSEVSFFNSMYILVNVSFIEAKELKTQFNCVCARKHTQICHLWKHTYYCTGSQISVHMTVDFIPVSWKQAPFQPVKYFCISEYRKIPYKCYHSLNHFICKKTALMSVLPAPNKAALFPSLNLKGKRCCQQHISNPNRISDDEIPQVSFSATLPIST